MPRETALGTVSVRIDPAWHGEIDAFIPIAGWGVRADAFSGPVRVHVEPRTADRSALVAAASGERDVLKDAEDDARAVVRGALVRASAWAVATALVMAAAAAALAGALGRAGVRAALAWTLLTTLLAGAICAGTVLRVASSFDATAFEAPTFYARGAELGELLKVADKAQRLGDRYTSSVQRTIGGYATLLKAGVQLAPVDTAQPAVLGSDLHGNRLVLRAVEPLFEGSPIFLAGDFGQRGTRSEARALIPQIAGLGDQVVAVSGNHDSRLFMRRLARAGVVVLTDKGRLRASGRTEGGPVRRIAGLRVAGYPDPLEWTGGDPSDPRRSFSFAERPDGEREHARAGRRLVAWFERLRPQPDVVLVHQNGLAQRLAREVAAGGRSQRLLILTGHDHQQHVDRYGNVLVVDAGTLGAGGIFGAGRQSVGVAQLHIPSASAWPRAVDLINVEPLSGAARAERILPSSPTACERELVRCHVVAP